MSIAPYLHNQNGSGYNITRLGCSRQPKQTNSIFTAVAMTSRSKTLLTAVNLCPLNPGRSTGRSVGRFSHLERVPYMLAPSKRETRVRSRCAHSSTEITAASSFFCFPVLQPHHECRSKTDHCSKISYLGSRDLLEVGVFVESGLRLLVERDQVSHVELRGRHERRGWLGGWLVGSSVRVGFNDRFFG